MSCRFSFPRAQVVEMPNDRLRLLFGGDPSTVTTARPFRAPPGKRILRAGGALSPRFTLRPEAHLSWLGEWSKRVLMRLWGSVCLRKQPDAPGLRHTHRHSAHCHRKLHIARRLSPHLSNQLEFFHLSRLHCPSRSINFSPLSRRVDLPHRRSFTLAAEAGSRLFSGHVLVGGFNAPLRDGRAARYHDRWGPNNLVRALLAVAIVAKPWR